MNDLKTEYLLSQYEEMSVLGQKKNHMTYLVKSITTGQLYVKKILSPDKTPIYSAIKDAPHPNLARIVDIFSTDEHCITIEEYISGKNLAVLLEEHKTFPEPTVCLYIRQLAEALRHIHGLNIIHRDIQPANVIISTDGVLHLIDFDIARTPGVNKSSDTTILGTAGYAAPEQFGFFQTDLRTDIYALGILMNVMLTGAFPNERIYRKTRLGVIVAKCIEMDANNRYGNTGALLAALDDYEKVPAKSQATPPVKKPFRYIPGFRSGTVWKMVLAIFGYIFLIWGLIIDLEPYLQYTPQIFIMESFAMLFMLIIPFLMLTNIGYFDRKIPPFLHLPKSGALALRITFAFLSMLFSGFFLSAVKSAVDLISSI